MNATFDWIAAHLRDTVDFVVWTGDSARHDSDEDIPRSADQVLSTNRLLAGKFAEVFGVDATSSDEGGDGGQVQRLAVPVIPTFGNNDILPHNILLPGPNKWLDTYSDLWSAFIPEEQRHSFEFGGWYYVEVIPNALAVFSLNTLYFFDRNAGVDDCVKPSEPGFKHMEWLRIQLQFMRERGMKAILMGHVPPARTDSKMLWDETCWQKYTLWLRQYRDVVVGGLYGHMNIDHFMLSDTKDINIDATAKTFYDDSDSDDDDDDDGDEIFVRENLDDELTIQSATDYLEELHQDWAKLPKVKLHSNMESGSKKKKKKKKGKGKGKDKLGGEFAERYQVSLVSPSIVPNYFPTLRVFEYNITGFENAMTWAEYDQPLPVIDTTGLYAQGELVGSQSGLELELRDLPDVEVDKKKKKKKKGDKDKKKKKKKGKKPNKDPNLIVPSPPPTTAPPGPAYSPQPLSLVGYEQYFANLTYLNNDIKAKDSEDADDLSPARWREGKHGHKKPKSSKPKPREFAFEIEYTTHDDRLYNLPDLTVRSFVELAYRMGRSAKANANANANAEDGGEDAGVTIPGAGIEELENQDAEGAGVESAEVDVDDDDDDEDDESDDSNTGDLDAQKKKKKGDKKKKKKKKKKDKKLNKIWLHFLRHAFVSTVDDEDLQEKFS